jgi:hypothetical protein
MPTKNQGLTKVFAWKPAACGAVGRAAGGLAGRWGRLELGLAVVA